MLNLSLISLLFKVKVSTPMLIDQIQYVSHAHTSAGVLTTQVQHHERRVCRTWTTIDNANMLLSTLATFKSLLLHIYKLEGELFKLIVVVRNYWSSIFHVETTIPQDFLYAKCR